MDIVRGILLVLHLVGWAIVLGAAVSNMRPARAASGLTHGALTALVTGVLLVGVIEMGGGDVNQVKIAVKLAVAAVVTVLTFLAVRKDKRGELTAGFLGGIAGLVVVNVAIAVLWH